VDIGVLRFFVPLRIGIGNRIGFAMQPSAIRDETNQHFRVAVNDQNTKYAAISCRIEHN